MATKKPTYEHTMRELERIVIQIESGELALEEAITAYENGDALVKALKGILSDAHRRITILTQAGEIPFEENVSKESFAEMKEFSNREESEIDA